MFKDLCESLGEPVLPSEIANTLEEGLQAARDIGYPVVLRPAFTLGGTGGGFADDEKECELMLKMHLHFLLFIRFLLKSQSRATRKLSMK